MIIMSSLISNILVLIALVTTPTTHFVSNIFFTSMSLADLGLTLLVMMPSAMMELMERWPLGFTLCQAIIIYTMAKFKSAESP